MDRNEETRRTKQARFSLSQETIAILTVGVALAGLILVNQGDMRAEARADRASMEAALNGLRTEARADRANMEAALNGLRAEARADRANVEEAVNGLRAEARADRANVEEAVNGLRAEARADRANMEAALNGLRAEARADREAFANQITRLVERQGTLSGLVEGLEHAVASSGD